MLRDSCRIVWIGLCWGALFAQSAGAQNPAAQEPGSTSARKAIESQYNKLEKSIKKRDLYAIEAFQTADFSAMTPDAELPTSAQSAMLTNTLLRSIRRPIKVEYTIEDLRLEGDVAVATVYQSFSRRQQLGPRYREIDSSVRREDTWVNTPEGWKLNSAGNDRDRTMTVDGAPVDPDKPYDPMAATVAPVSASVSS